jgi:tRNA dimethylallyltransferase
VGCNPIIFLFGPTAVGKTELACALAEGIGEIISVDSMQVYREMDLGTAKPTDEQRRRVPHHLVDVFQPDRRFSAGDFRRLALVAIEEVQKRGKVPFLVGGTGLYFRAIEYDLLDVPPGDLRLRDSLYRMEEESPGILHERLKRVDPDAAERLHPNDILRIVRALEIVHCTGSAYSRFLSRAKQRVISPLKIGLTIQREELYRRIEERCSKMIASGLVWEVRNLIERGCTEKHPSMKGLGYSHYVQYFKGCLSHGETVRLFIRDTKRYAKRQITWFRREKDTAWYHSGDFEVIRKRVLGYIESTRFM